MPAPLTWTAKRVASVRYGVDWSATDYLDDTSWLDVPTLVFHGAEDDTVPLRTSEALREAHPDLVALEVVAGAAHVGSWNVDPQRYDARLSPFLDAL